MHLRHLSGGPQQAPSCNADPNWRQVGWAMLVPTGLTLDWLLCWCRNPAHNQSSQSQQRNRMSPSQVTPQGPWSPQSTGKLWASVSLRSSGDRSSSLALASVCQNGSLVTWSQAPCPSLPCGCTGDHRYCSQGTWAFTLQPEASWGRPYHLHTFPDKSVPGPCSCPPQGSA